MRMIIPRKAFFLKNARENHKRLSLISNQFRVLVLLCDLCAVISMEYMSKAQLCYLQRKIIIN